MAAVTVLAAHVLQPYTPANEMGRFGVLLFFLISGYVIVWSLEGLRDRPVRSFIIRRAFRLYPAYWSAVIFSTVLGVEAVTIGKVVANLTMLQTALGVRDIDGVYWTLFLEFIFYGVITVLLYAGLARSYATYWVGFVGVTLAALVAALTWRLIGVHVPFGHLLYFSYFAFGGVTSLFERRGHGLKGMWLVALPYVLVQLAISHLIYGGRVIADAFDPNYFFAASTVPVILFLAALRNRWLTWAWLAFVGDLSYSIYLFHSPIRAVLATRIPGRGSLLVAVLGVTIIVAIVIRNAVELPSIALGRRLSRRVARA